MTQPDATPPDRTSRRHVLAAAFALPATALAATAKAAKPAAKAKAKPKAKSKGTPLKELYPGANLDYFREIQADENDHVALITNALGAAARPKPTFQNLEAPTYSKFAEMSDVFENTGVGAYLAASAYINSKGILAVAGSIANVEAYHSGFLNTLLNVPIVPDRSPFALPLTQQEVRDRLAPYIVSLNGGPTPGYDLARSDANDINILNFALVAEYLEAEFYNINVPKFFG